MGRFCRFCRPERPLGALNCRQVGRIGTICTPYLSGTPALHHPADGPICRFCRPEKPQAGDPRPPALKTPSMGHRRSKKEVRWTGLVTHGNPQDFLPNYGKTKQIVWNVMMNNSINIALIQFELSGIVFDECPVLSGVGGLYPFS